MCLSYYLIYLWSIINDIWSYNWSFGIFIIIFIERIINAPISSMIRGLCIIKSNILWSYNISSRSIIRRKCKIIRIINDRYLLIMIRFRKIFIFLIKTIRQIFSYNLLIWMFRIGWKTEFIFYFRANFNRLFIIFISVWKTHLIFYFMIL